MPKVARCPTAHGREALATLTQVCEESTASCPALILLDLNMPVMNGIEFLEAYQQLPQRQAIVIVLLTTSVNPRELARVQQRPIAGVLTKPSPPEKVQQVLHEHFGLAAG